jgi:hypothetical protein
MERDRGTVVALAGVALLVVTLAASAALAPPREVGDSQGSATLVGVQGAGPGFHETGNVQLLNGSGMEWQQAVADSYFEAEQLPDGNVVVAFISDGYEACGDFESPCPRTGYRILDPDDGFEVVEEYTFPVRSKTNSETHAVDPLPDGGFALVDMDRERLLVVEDGEVAWEWSASSFYEAPPDPTRVDWLHMNDVEYLGEDRFMVSVRNANQIVIVERGEGVVEVVNEDRGEASEETCRQPGELTDYDDDGEVRCGDPGIIHRQHNPHWLGDGGVLVADSENDRVVELARTDDGWEPVWSLERAGSLDLHWPRDADRLPNGNTLVTDTFNKRVVEVTGNGTVVWGTSVEDVPYEADRLPSGEQVGVPTYDGDGAGIEASEGGGVPILSTVVVALHAGVPGMPYWVQEPQVLFALVSLALVAVGLVVRYRSSAR